MSSQRYDGLDFVRAGAMLLGVFSHAARAYVPDYERWYPIADPMTTPLALIFVGVLNAFQLQLFFALSGFFGHMVLERRAADAFFATARAGWWCRSSPRCRCCSPPTCWCAAGARPAD